DKTLVEEFKEGNSLDINSLIAAMESLKISKVEKKADDDIKKIKNVIKQLTKAVTNFTNKAYIIRMFRKTHKKSSYMTEKTACDKKEYLEVELVSNRTNDLKEELNDIKNLDKRRCDNLVDEVSNKKEKF
ncbi:13999_t:CDS:2, partial [Racocetra persica]